MHGAKNEIIVPSGDILPHPGLIIPVKAIFHAPADLQAAAFQAVIFRAVGLLGEYHRLLLRTADIIHVVGKADLLQPGALRRLHQRRAGVVAVEGDAGVHMVIKHGRFPPRIGGTPWAAPPVH